jgi:hypothetical protein
MGATGGVGFGWGLCASEFENLVAEDEQRGARSAHEDGQGNDDQN